MFSYFTKDSSSTCIKSADNCNGILGDGLFYEISSPFI